MVNQIFIQAGYYGVVMVLSLFIVGIIMRGFFWKFVRVRLSFGKYVLAKIRAVNRDYYRVGWVEEEFLVFKSKKGGERRIPIPDNSYFYRSVGLSWVDVDDKSSSLTKPDYSTQNTFDAEKYDNLYKRALTRPQINDKMEKVLLAAAIIAAIAAIIAVAIGYKSMNDISILNIAVESLKKGVIIGSGGV